MLDGLQLAADTFQGFQEMPDSYSAGETSKWVFTIWAGGLGIAILPWVLWMWLKRGDSVPVLVWIGGWIVSLGEPMLDHIGHLWWPDDLPGSMWSGFGVTIPFLNPACYVFFVAFTGYFAYRRMEKGISAREVWAIWAALCFTDFVLELPGTLSKVYDYYGYQPLDIGGFPLFWAWLNGTGFLAIGFLLWLVVPRVKGVWKLTIALIPVYGFLGAYGVVGWPAWIALNWDMSHLAMNVVALSSLPLALIAVKAMATVVEHQGLPPRIVEAVAPPPAPAAEEPDKVPAGV